MKKQKIENIVYLIVIAIICFLYFYVGRDWIAIFAFAPFIELLGILSGELNVIEGIIGIIASPIPTCLIGGVITATCFIVCKIPIGIFHQGHRFKNKAKDNACNKVFDWTIKGVIAVVILSSITFFLFPSKTPTINGDDYLYVDRCEECHLNKECFFMSGEYTPIQASNIENYSRCLCCVDLEVEPIEKDTTSDSAEAEEQSSDDTSSEPSSGEQKTEDSFDTITKLPEFGTIKKLTEPEEENSTEEDTPKDNTSSEEETTKEEQVYITPTGSKYHRRKCGRGSYYPIEKQEAINDGYEPCDKCW